MSKIYFARFRHIEDRKWYLAWTRQFKSGWSVHRLYLPEDIAILQPGARFWELVWSSCKEDELNEVDAISEWTKLCQVRIVHGYTLEQSGTICINDDGTYGDAADYDPLEGSNENNT